MAAALRAKRSEHPSNEGEGGPGKERPGNPPLPPLFSTHPVLSRDFFFARQTSILLTLVFVLRCEQALGRATIVASPLSNTASNDGNTSRSSTASPSKAAFALAAAAAASGSSSSARVAGGDGGVSSPLATSGSGASMTMATAKPPQQRPQPRKLGFFDSLWQLDISYERGRAKE